MLAAAAPTEKLRTNPACGHAGSCMASDYANSLV
jgi:hypothetical protein